MMGFASLSIYEPLRSKNPESRSHEFPQPNQRDLPRPVLAAKINLLLATPKSVATTSAVPARQEGRIAIVTDVGLGMRWTRQRRAREGCSQGGS